MDTSVFYRGFLFALRLTDLPPKFHTDDERFHRAFKAALEYAREIDARVPVDELLSLDPVFGVYRHATRMLLEGESDFIVSLLNPGLQAAQFEITKATAEKELQELPFPADTFRALAAKFHESYASG